MSFFHKKWRLHLYLDGVYIASTTIKPDEKPNENIYVVRAYFKKHVFGSNYAKIIVHPTRFIYIDEKKRQISYSFEFEKGVEE